jgi:hypothetical protein
MTPSDGIKIRINHFLLHNQWQVGNYLTQKQVKRVGCFQVCTMQKLLLVVVLDGSQPLWLGC